MNTSDRHGWHVQYAATSLAAAAFCVSLLCPLPAHADAGLPMLQVMAIPMWVSLLVIIPLEAVIARRILSLNWEASFRVSTIANLISSLLGVPITWGILAACEMAIDSNGLFKLFYADNTHPIANKLLFFLATSPWLYPMRSDLYWMVPAAALVLCIPFFFVSVWSEYLVARRLIASAKSKDTLRWAWKANLASYGLMVLIIIALGIASIREHNQIANDEKHRDVDFVSADRLWELALPRAKAYLDRMKQYQESNTSTKASSLISARQFEAARKLLESNKRNGDNSDMGLGIVYQKLGDFAKAQQFYDDFINTKHPERVGDASYSDKARVAYALMDCSPKHRDVDRATQLYKDAIASMTSQGNWTFYNGTLDQAYCGLAQVYLLQNRFVQAEQLLQRAIDKKNETYDFGEFNLKDEVGLMSLKLASVYIAEGKYDLSEHWIKQAFRCNDVLPQVLGAVKSDRH